MLQCNIGAETDIFATAMRQGRLIARALGLQRKKTSVVNRKTGINTAPDHSM